MALFCTILKGVRVFRGVLYRRSLELYVALLSLCGTAICAGDAEKEEGESEVMRRFKKDHRGARKAWDVPLDFPNWRVVEAYTQVRVPPGIR